jgi:Sec-independent protein translocase protein TatA
MDFFGIGWLELFFILIIVLLVAGPKDLEKGAKGLGRTINRLNKSPGYQAIRRASTELRNLPQRLAREANLEELKELSNQVAEVKQEVQQVKQELQENTSNIAGTTKAFQAWVQPQGSAPNAPDKPESLPVANTPPPPAPAAPAANGPAPATNPTAPKDA